MTSGVGLTTAFVVATVVFGMAPSARMKRLPAAVAGTAPDDLVGQAVADGTASDVLSRGRSLVAVLAGLFPVLLLGGAAGVMAGVVATVVAWRTLAAREGAAARRHRLLVARSLPHAMDLLAVTLAAGASPAAALGTVARAVEEPLRGELAAVQHGLALGRDPVRVWRDVSARPGLAPLGRCMVRALDTGASVATALERLADELQALERLEAESRARSVGVKAAAPLGLCLLPAFVLVAVVPLVGSTVTVLLAP